MHGIVAGMLIATDTDDGAGRGEGLSSSTSEGLQLLLGRESWWIGAGVGWWCARGFG